MVNAREYSAEKVEDLAIFGKDSFRSLMIAWEVNRESLTFMSGTVGRRVSSDCDSLRHAARASPSSLEEVIAIDRVKASSRVVRNAAIGWME